MTPHLNHLIETVQMSGHNMLSMRRKNYKQILPLIQSSESISLPKSSDKGGLSGLFCEKSLLPHWDPSLDLPSRQI